MDFESFKRLGLDHCLFDQEKSYEQFDPSTNNHTIHLFLLKVNLEVCPICGSTYNFIRNSKVLHLKYASALEDNINIILHRRVYKCKDCNHLFKEKNPFGDSRLSLTLQKEIKILNELKNINSSYTSVAERFNVSPTTVINIFDKKVDLKRELFTEVICVDEVYSRKISFSSYCFIIYSPQRKTILDVLPSRKKETLESYFSKISIKERDSVKFFSIDLYQHYRLIARKYFPKAKVSADSFHVIKNLNTDFQKIRIRVMKHYSYLKYEKHNFYWLYKKYWKLLLIDRTKLSYSKFKVSKSGTYLTEHEIIEYMLSLDDTLRLAYEIKEEYRVFNLTASTSNAREWLEELIIRFQNSNIQEYIHFWKLLKNWKEEILNSFNRVNGYRISNGPMERVNRDIKTILRNSFGSTNFYRTRNRIMFSINPNSSILYYRKETTNKKTGKTRSSYLKHK